MTKRRGKPWQIAVLGGCVSLTGCLSLGGRTTYVNDNPETNQKISQLERRVGNLERALIGGPVVESLPMIESVTPR
jgi:hypothetical protein